MDRATLISDTFASLHDAANVLNAETDGPRLIDVALNEFSRKLPARETLRVDWTCAGVTVGVDTRAFRVGVVVWSAAQRAACADVALPVPPRSRLEGFGPDKKLRLLAAHHGPVPARGNCDVTLHLHHQLPLDPTDTDTPCTIPEEQHSLLRLRCQIEALRELASRNITKAVTLRDGVTQG
ncbi:MAG: hypothetical protein AAF499_14605, partial [Pseudomonadota bacterium]